MLEGRVNVLKLTLAIGDENAVCGLLNRLGQLAQHLLGQSMPLLQRLIGDCPFNGWRQPGEVMLDDEVLCPALDCRHGGLFAERAGDEDKRNIRIKLPDDAQRARTVK